MRKDQSGKLEQTFFLPLPPSVNNLYLNLPGRGRVKSPKYRAWINEAGWKLLATKPVKVTGDLTLIVRAIRPDNRRRDLGNLEKAVSDLLVAHRVIDDDSSITSLSMQWTSENLADGISVTLIGQPRETTKTA